MELTNQYISKYKVLLDSKCKNISKLLYNNKRIKNQDKKSFIKFNITDYIVNKKKELVNEYIKELLEGFFTCS